MAVIGDADLKRFGFYNESVNLFDMPEELIHNPLNGTKRKLLTGEHVSKFG
jgi:penicillin G amidase